MRRRRFLAAGAGVGILGAAGCLRDGSEGTNTGEEAGPGGTPVGDTEPQDRAELGAPDDGEWHRVESPVGVDLTSVVMTREGPVAVGEDGVLLMRGRGAWAEMGGGRTEATSNGLAGVDATAGGGRVWFAGTSGVLGMLNLADLALVDYSEPMEMTSSWEDVAVTGTAGEERVYLANGSGQVLRGRFDGGDIEWLGVASPGRGSSFTTVHFYDRGTGFLGDSNGNLYRTTNGGNGWNGVGIRGVDSEIFDIGVMDPNMVQVATSGGHVQRYNGTTWVQLDTGDADTTGLDLQSRDAGGGLAVDAEGKIYEYSSGVYQQTADPAGTGLNDVVYGTASAPRVAVGSGGAIVEQFPGGGGG